MRSVLRRPDRPIYLSRKSYRNPVTSEGSLRVSDGLEEETTEKGDDCGMRLVHGQLLRLQRRVAMFEGRTSRRGCFRCAILRDGLGKIRVSATYRSH